MSSGGSSTFARSRLMVFNAQSMIGQRPQAEEVELHQAGRFNVILVELGHQTVTGLIAIEQGKKSVSLVGAITTPPACLPTLRTTPSSLRAISQISAASSSTLMKSR